MDAPLIRAMGLHALAYCERLFYLEEVEELRVADERVWAGRRLHEELGEEGDVVDLTLESERLGVRGRLDAVRRRDGGWYPVEHKRGRAMRGMDNAPLAWPSDRLQAIAYAALLAEHLGEPVREARVRYHQDKVTVPVPVRDLELAELGDAVRRARGLAQANDRPPVSADERRCVRCSLAPVCLPEESRLARVVDVEGAAAPTPVRLYSSDPEARSLHVVTQGAKVGRSDRSFVVYERERDKLGVAPAREVSDVVLHGFAQITTQALRLAADEGVPVHWVTTTGTHIGTFAPPSTSPQRKLRQYRALADSATALGLARRLVVAKLEMQLRALLRASRKEGALRAAVDPALRDLRGALRGAARADGTDELLGHEGNGAKAYFGAVPALVVDDAGPELKPRGRSRRPPEDRFNALLSFGYGLLVRDVESAVLRVGLEPALGIYHRPRSAAHPLTLDLMELFRVPMVDMAVLAAVNRRTFDAAGDFVVTGKQVWLSEQGRKKLIEVYERRKLDEYRHDVVGYSLSYARLMELEVRLLEKEWSGEPGLFATFRIR